MKVKVKSLSRVRLFVTPWIVAYQAPPSMGFSRQEYWNGVLGWYNGAQLITRRRQWHPTPVLLPRKSHGQRSLVGCSPWGH